jgi:hypothetical protein
MGCNSLRNAQTVVRSTAVRFHNQLPRNHLQRVTRAGFEPATYGLKERPRFIPRGRPRTSKFVPVLHLYSSGVRSRFPEFLGVPRTSRDKWGARRVQSRLRASRRRPLFAHVPSSSASSTPRVYLMRSVSANWGALHAATRWRKNLWSKSWSNSAAISVAFQCGFFDRRRTPDQSPGSRLRKGPMTFS